MKKTALLFAFSFSLLALSAQTLTELTAAYTGAAEAMKTKKFASAVTLFEEIIADGDAVTGAEELVSGAKNYLPVAMFQNGGAQFQAGNLDGALASFTAAAEAAELYGNVSILNNARTWIGRTVLKQGADAFNGKDYATAAAIFQKGYQGNPNDTEVALNLALSYCEMGDYARGNEVYKHIISLEGRHSRFDEPVAQAKEKILFYARYRVSQAAQDKDYNAIVSASQDYLDEFPTDAEFNMNLLSAYNSLKDYAKIIELGDGVILTQAAADAKSNANFMVAAAYQNRENYPKAIEYYRRVTSGPYAATARTQATELQKIVK